MCAHWYHPDGRDQHTVIGSSTGKERDTTIADARKMGLLPSVTTILDLLDKPQLGKWKMDQVALAARRLYAAGRAFPMDDKAYCNILRTEAFQQVEDAADLGTKVHAAVDSYFNGREYDPALHVYVDGVDKWVKENAVRIVEHEKTLVNKEVGYAGKTDGIITCPRGMGILDFKTRKTKPEYPNIDAYDGQATQIAAYYVANFANVGSAGEDWDNACGVNLFISSTEPGRVGAVWYDAETLADEYRFFRHLAACWQIRRGYSPPGSTIY